MYTNCVRGAILHSSECWALRQEDTKRLELSQQTILLWMCNMKKEQRISKNSLLSRLKLKNLDLVLRRSRLCLIEHVKQSELYWTNFGLGSEGK